MALLPAAAANFFNINLLNIGVSARVPFENITITTETGKAYHKACVHLQLENHRYIICYMNAWCYFQTYLENNADKEEIAMLTYSGH